MATQEKAITGQWTAVCDTPCSIWNEGEYGLRYAVTDSGDGSDDGVTYAAPAASFDGAELRVDGKKSNSATITSVGSVWVKSTHGAGKVAFYPYGT